MPKGSLVYQSINDDGDYHQEMNHAIFEEWFETQLLPNIPPDSLIAMDNASYHSRRKEAVPTSSWHKGDMITWLMEKGIPYPDKKILYDIICKHKVCCR